MMIKVTRAMLKKIVDNRRADSWATKMRRRRFDYFCSLLSQLDPPITILDVGVTIGFWESMEFPADREIKVTILNQIESRGNNPRFVFVKGDACELEFKDGQFDVVFSNSVIEHVGGLVRQKQMAVEVSRVGKRYFIQTPIKNFPLEPHFLVPFFQFFPIKLKIWMLMQFNLGWFKRQTNEKTAKEIANSITLLNVEDFQNLFPESILVKEKIFGLTKSMTVYKGW